jgi:dipeptidase
MELPDIGPLPTETFNPASLWWKHELLHRRAMADFDNLMPEIRKDFDALEAAFLAEAVSVRRGSMAEKKDFMDDCFIVPCRPPRCGLPACGRAAT